MSPFFLLAIFAAANPAGMLSEASPQTLLERVREHGDLRLSSAPTFPVMGLDDVVAKSDLVVRAKVISVDSHLSSDGRSVVSDFGLEPLAVLLERHSARRAPGPGQRLIVTLLGGDIVLEGHNVRWSDASLKRFEVGKEYVLFLQQPPALDAFILTGHSNGAFEVRGDTIEPRMEGPENRREPLGQFIKRVQEIVARSK